MEQNKKAAELVMYLGVRFGLVFILFNLIKFYFRLETQSIGLSAILWFVGVGIYVGMLVFTIKHIRDKVFEGYISFLSALSYGTSTIFVAAFLSSIISFVYFQWIDVYFLSTRTHAMLDLVQNFYESMNVDQLVINTIEELKENVGTPSAINGASSQLFSNISLAFIAGLIVSLILRKDKPLN